MSRGYPPEEIARHYPAHALQRGWAVQVVAASDLLNWEDGSPRVEATWKQAEAMAHGTLRASRAMQTGFATGVLDD